MAAPKGWQIPNKPKGRTPGVPNKSTASVKAALLEAFEKRGGVEALLAWSEADPTEFYRLWSKILPQELTATVTIDDKLADGVAKAWERVKRDRKA